MKKVSRRWVIVLVIIGTAFVGGLLFISYLPSAITREMIKIEKIVYPEDFKGIVLELNMADEKLTILEYEIVDGYPNYLPGTYPFVARIFSFDEELLGEYGFGDPRIILAERGYVGPTRLSDMNFTLILPYFHNAKTINIYSATKLLLSINICIDSDAQCKGKPDGTSCTYGIWCDEYGRVCGGQSCVGLGLGECRSERCVMR
jgi:hypothetical protein